MYLRHLDQVFRRVFGARAIPASDAEGGAHDARPMMRIVLMVALMFGATALPVQATDQDALLTSLVSTAPSPRSRWITTGGISLAKRVSSPCLRSKGLIEQFSHKIVIESYLLRGLSDHTDLMFRASMRMPCRIRSNFSPLCWVPASGRHLVATAIYSLTRKADYVPGFPGDMKQELLAPGRGGANPLRSSSRSERC